MGFTSLLTLLDDIATTLDDVAVMTKVAVKKTAGVLGDDLAVNAEQVSGSSANRELPIVFQVALGSLINKAILVPLALLIATFIPWLITPLLMLGGAYLCFEGAEKIIHAFAPPKSKEGKVVFDEKARVKGAIRTDFILSAEIIVIALGVVATETLLNKALVLSVLAVVMTIGVYGAVALIVKLDDIGLWLMQKSARLWQKIGRFLVRVMPYLMHFLSFAGTIAMFLVGGGILLHGVPPIGALAEHLATQMPTWATGLPSLVLSFVVGLLAGFIILTAWHFKSKIMGQKHE